MILDPARQLSKVLPVAEKMGFFVAHGIFIPAICNVGFLIALSLPARINKQYFNGGNRRLKMRGSTSASIRTSIYPQKNEKPLLANLCRRVVLVSGAGLVGAALLTLTGCAGAPIPTEQLAVSKTQIDSATTAGGTEFAPLELKTANEKLDAANRAVSEKEYEKAARLASEAQVDAKLAETKALSAKAEKAVAETQDHLRTMLQEVNRNSQQQQQQLEQQRAQ